MKITRREFDDYIRRKTGLQPVLQIPGNYARELLDLSQNHLLSDFLSVEDTHNRELISDINGRFIHLRSTYRATKPLPQYVSQYKCDAVCWGRYVKSKLPWAGWPNYFHRIIEHVQEIIIKKGSTGALSAEGSEANNKQTRMYRSLRSRTDSPANSMADVLQLGWLVGSRELQKLGSVSIRKYRCGNCGESGHSKRSCSASLQEDCTIDFDLTLNDK